MTALDTTLRPAVRDMISSLGVAATLEMPAPSFNATAGTGFGQPASESVTVTPPVPVTEKFIDGTTVFATDSMVYAGGYLTNEPEPGATLYVAGALWRIVQAKRYYSGDAIAAWALVIRR